MANPMQVCFVLRYWNSFHSNWISDNTNCISLNGLVVTRDMYEVATSTSCCCAMCYPVIRLMMSSQSIVQDGCSDGIASMEPRRVRFMTNVMIKLLENCPFCIWCHDLRMRCVSEQVNKTKTRKLEMTQDFSENVTCSKARAAHDAVCEHDHKFQFHGDKWPKTEYMQIPHPNHPNPIFLYYSTNLL